ncbi:MAG: 50S ribosomal protein L5 [Candidatus Jidaibacter sp.]|jgi:large subunit ribosomal protein L5|nr:50S ribosomal protein L5 [Candidatus Jidaibacter sp.]
MTVYKNRLQDYYEKEIAKNLMDNLGLKNRFEVPKLVKIVVSMGVKDAVVDSKVVEKAADDLMMITGQKPVITKAKKAIAAFKLKPDMPIGCKVTLRKAMMYDFLDKFINIALPRVKDFRGLSPKKFDGNGNYAVGLKEHIIFPEINYDKVDKIRGMNIVFVTTAKNNEQALELLKLFNFPFIN